jgi:hypothetical protein
MARYRQIMSESQEKPEDRDRPARIDVDSKQTLTVDPRGEAVENDLAPLRSDALGNCG